MLRMIPLSNWNSYFNRSFFLEQIERLRMSSNDSPILRRVFLIPLISSKCPPTGYVPCNTLVRSIFVTEGIQELHVDFLVLRVN